MLVVDFIFVVCHVCVCLYVVSPPKRKHYPLGCHGHCSAPFGNEPPVPFGNATFIQSYILCLGNPTIVTSENPSHISTNFLSALVVQEHHSLHPSTVYCSVLYCSVNTTGSIIKTHSRTLRYRCVNNVALMNRVTTKGTRFTHHSREGSICACA